jgi:hypothetical protein
MFLLLIANIQGWINALQRRPKLSLLGRKGDKAFQNIVAEKEVCFPFPQEDDDRTNHTFGSSEDGSQTAEACAGTTVPLPQEDDERIIIN